MNENPEGFPEDQLRMGRRVRRVAGGVDLEHIQLNNAAEATAMLLPRGSSVLAVAEEAMKFEHRDLHWGNVLLPRCGVDETRRAAPRRRGLTRCDQRLGGQHHRLTLSRLEMGGGKKDVAFLDRAGERSWLTFVWGTVRATPRRRPERRLRGRGAGHCARKTK